MKVWILIKQWGEYYRYEEFKIIGVYASLALAQEKARNEGYPLELPLSEHESRATKSRDKAEHTLIEYDFMKAEPFELEGDGE